MSATFVSTEHVSRDSEGYPLTARRKLKRVGDMFEDINTRQRFKAHKAKDGIRLLPVYLKRVTWKTMEGYEAAQLLMSCMGAEGEYQLWSKKMNAQMTPTEWVQKGMVAVSKPPIKHIKCGQVVTTSMLTNLQHGCRIGCKCHYTNAEQNMWVNKRDVVVEWGKKGDYELVTTPEEWKRECTGAFYCPKLKCIKCNEFVSKTTLNNMQQGTRIGCRCHSNNAKANMWVNRRDELVELGRNVGFEVVTTEEEWKRDCTNAHYYPTLKCLNCNELVKTTQVNHLQNGTGIGCGCRNKTETKVANWLSNRLPEVAITTQFPGPGQGTYTTHFDIHLRFPDGFEVIVEIDGAQHFWENTRFFDLDACKRDLLKEKWSLDYRRNINIIRLVQEDAWKDQNGWETFLMRSIDAARNVERARVFHPDAPEYTSENSAYVKLRKTHDSQPRPRG